MGAIGPGTTPSGNSSAGGPTGPAEDGPGGIGIGWRAINTCVGVDSDGAIAALAGTTLSDRCVKKLPGAGALLSGDGKAGSGLLYG
jgi:hypothetical protein